MEDVDESKMQLKSDDPLLNMNRGGGMF
jgi:regulator of protease activity HflC (stomatin/prohibitin superfamily)